MVVWHCGLVIFWRRGICGIGQEGLSVVNGQQTVMNIRASHSAVIRDDSYSSLQLCCTLELNLKQIENADGCCRVMTAMSLQSLWFYRILFISITGPSVWRGKRLYCVKAKPLRGSSAPPGGQYWLLKQPWRFFERKSKNCIKASLSFNKYHVTRMCRKCPKINLQLLKHIDTNSLMNILASDEWTWIWVIKVQQLLILSVSGWKSNTVDVMSVSDPADTGRCCIRLECVHLMNESPVFIL